MTLNEFDKELKILQDAHKRLSEAIERERKEYLEVKRNFVEYRKTIADHLDTLGAPPSDNVWTRFDLLNQEVTRLRAKS